MISNSSETENKLARHILVSVGGNSAFTFQFSLGRCKYHSLNKFKIFPEPIRSFTVKDNHIFSCYRDISLQTQSHRLHFAYIRINQKNKDDNIHKSEALKWNDKRSKNVEKLIVTVYCLWKYLHFQVFIIELLRL